MQLYGAHVRQFRFRCNAAIDLLAQPIELESNALDGTVVLWMSE